MKRLVVALTAFAAVLAWVLTSVVLPAGTTSAALASQARAGATVITAGGFTSVAPSLLLDTRIGVGAPKAPIEPYGTLHLQVSGRGGIPATGVSAVVLNVTVTGPTSLGFVTVYSEGLDLPKASNLNFVAGQTVPNLVIARVGDNGMVDLYNGSKGTVQLIADVSGYYLAGAPQLPGAFGSLAPARLLDTRASVGAPKAPVAAHSTVHLQVTGRGGVPATGVSAVVLNVTVTRPAHSGYVSVYGYGATRSGTPNLSFVSGQTVPNLVAAQVGPNGQVDLYNGSPGEVQLIADVSGYYLSGGPQVAGAFGSSAPTRLLDTRAGIGAPRAVVPPHGMVHLRVAGRGGVPDSGAAAVALNVTVTSPTMAGNVSVYGDGTDLPGMPNLTFEAAQTVPNLVIAPIGANGNVTLYNGSRGTIHLIADVAGSYLGGTTSAAAVSAGAFHSCAVTTSGGVKCWGSNSSGELGDGTTKGSSQPVGVIGLGKGVSAVSVGASHSCAVTTGGAVKCWGSNGSGSLGDGTTAGSALPVGVSGLFRGVAAVSVGASHSCALTTAGAVLCWGSNAYGELGSGSTAIASPVPVRVHGLGSGVVAVSAGGSHTCAVTAAGAVTCWGANFHGELGDGTTTGSSVPVGVVGLGSGVARVSAGMFHSCALTSAAAVKCWGLNRDNELGNGSASDSAVPVDVLGLGSGVAALSAGMFHSCVLTPAGSVRCWGKNSAGELGNGSTAQPEGPDGVAGLRSGLVAVSAGGHHACAVTSTGAVRCWGLNGDGELGDGTTTSSRVPVPVVGLG